MEQIDKQISVIMQTILDIQDAIMFLAGEIDKIKKGLTWVLTNLVNVTN